MTCALYVLATKVCHTVTEEGGGVIAASYADPKQFVFRILTCVSRDYSFYCFIMYFIHPHCNSLRTSSLGAMLNKSVTV